MELEQQIEQFLAGSPHAVVGASTDRTKYGNKVLRAFMQRDRLAFPVNPHATEIESLTAYSSLSDLPKEVHGISVVTPPSVTEQVVEQAVELGIQRVWMQPGAESDLAVELAEQNGMQVIANGPCILVALKFRE